MAKPVTGSSSEAANNGVVTDKPRAKYKRVNGQLRRIKRPDSKQNAKMHRKANVKHGGYLTGRTNFDGRSREARLRKHTIVALGRDYLGGAIPTEGQSIFFELVANLRILGSLAFSDLVGSGLSPGTVDALIRTSREVQSALEANIFTSSDTPFRSLTTEELHAMSDEELAALAGYEPIKNPPEPAPDRPQPTARQPTLLLPGPAKPRPRIRKRGVEPVDEPSEPNNGPVPTDAKQVYTEFVELPVNPEVLRKRKLAQEFQSDAITNSGIANNPDSPWNFV